MARAAQIYRFTCAAGGVDTILADAGFYKVLSATGTIEVARSDGSRIGPLLPGQGEREQFQRLTIKDTSGAANTGLILVADSSFEDTRIYGNVEVVDGGRQITLEGKSFVGSTYVANGAGLYSHAQLFNPVANTKWACVKRVVCTSHTGFSEFSVRPHNVALPTPQTAPKQKNLLAGSSAGTMEVWADQNVAVLGASTIGQIYANSYATCVFDFSEPVLIPPGKGLLAVNTLVNAAIRANFDFYEFTP